jgi:uncharacterized membrane protein (Fun14 family)
MKMSEVLTSILPIIFPLSIGGIGGFFTGYAVKKVYRLVMIIGVFIFSIAYMAYLNVIDLNINALVETMSTFIATFGPFIITPLTSSLLLMGSFIAGLLLGLMKG